MACEGFAMHADQVPCVSSHAVRAAVVLCRRPASLARCPERPNKVLKLLQHFCAAYGMRVNAGKCKVLGVSCW